MESDPFIDAHMAKVGDELALYCAPALIVPFLEAPAIEIIAGGTFTLVETPSRQLFITAFHVWKRLAQAKQEHPSAAIAAYLGPSHGVIALTEIEFLDGDEYTIDLAVLHAPRAGRLHFGGKRFFGIPEWPIPSVSERDVVHLIGYAGVDREEGLFVLDLGYSHFALGVSSVSGRQFVLAPTFGPRVFSLKNPEHGDRFQIGGMSGGPAFLYRDGIWQLVGFVREGRYTDDPIFLTHAAFLQPDGSIDHLAIPH